MMTKFGTPEVDAWDRAVLCNAYKLFKAVSQCIHRMLNALGAGPMRVLVRMSSSGWGCQTSLQDLCWEAAR